VKTEDIHVRSFLSSESPLCHPYLFNEVDGSVPTEQPCKLMVSHTWITSPANTPFLEENKIWIEKMFLTDQTQVDTACGCSVPLKESSFFSL
jgi:hypothetical protein